MALHESMSRLGGWEGYEVVEDWDERARPAALVRDSVEADPRAAALLQRLWSVDPSHS